MVGVRRGSLRQSRLFLGLKSRKLLFTFLLGSIHHRFEVQVVFFALCFFLLLNNITLGTFRIPATAVESLSVTAVICKHGPVI